MQWLINLIITTMIFFPEKNLYDFPANHHLISEDVSITTSDGVRLHGWYLKSPADKGTLLFFHGNAGNISGRLLKAQGWIERGYNVFLIDYRGYGKSESKIKNQNDLYLDAKAAFEWLKENKESDLAKIIFYGESLGTYPATRMAADYAAAALVLEAPFTSFTDLGKKYYPFVPSGWIKDFAFANIDYIETIKTPLFILHGTRDEIVPYEMGKKLYETAVTAKEMHTLEGAAHNNLPQAGGVDYWNRSQQFIEKN